jgi:hypothetical protein
MKLRDYLRTRRQQKERKRYEQDKARQEAAQDPKAMERAKGAAGAGGAFLP